MTLTRTTKVLLIILFLLTVITAIYWFQPGILDIDIISTLSSLNPFGSQKESVQAPEDVNISANQSLTNNKKTVSDIQKSDSVQEPEQEELSVFEKEIQQRHQSYQTKVYTYEPYQLPVSRNPFQRLVKNPYLGDEEKEREMSSEEVMSEFVRPELPPDSQFSGIITSHDQILGILVIEQETYIVKEDDIILNQFKVKSIQEKRMVIDINGYEISLELGGGEA